MSYPMLATDRRRVFVGSDLRFSGKPLREILRDQRIEIVERPNDRSLGRAIAECRPPSDLLILGLNASDPGMLDEIREVRTTLRGRQTPILGVASLSEGSLDIAMLRAHGVIGVIDKRVSGDVLVRRVENVLGPMGKRRFSERAPSFLPVAVKGHNGVEEEYVLNMSISGMRVTSRFPIEANTDLRFSFRLPMISDELIEANGRVVHQMPKRNSAGRYEMGVFLYPMGPRAEGILEREMARLLGD